jgi:hypothetical protein
VRNVRSCKPFKAFGQQAAGQAKGLHHPAGSFVPILPEGAVRLRTLHPLLPPGPRPRSTGTSLLQSAESAGQ